jgi:hypothetical protein
MFMSLSTQKIYQHDDKPPINRSTIHDVRYMIYMKNIFWVFCYPTFVKNKNLSIFEAVNNQLSIKFIAKIEEKCEKLFKVHLQKMKNKLNNRTKF